MPKEDIIGKTKKQVIKDIVKDVYIMEAMGNELDGSFDEAIYKYIFPYYHVIGTIQEAHSYICMQMDMMERERWDDEDNPLLRRYALTLYIIVNQSIMQMPLTGGVDRLDYLSNLVVNKFDGRSDFGIGELKLVQNQENSLDQNHRLRILTFITKDTVGTFCE